MEIRDGGLADLPRVLELLKQAKATVGFLPDEAVEERVWKGTLLVATDDGDVIGYLLYDLPGDTVTIRQLAIAREMRGRGAARALVDELVRRYGDVRRGMRLTCRRDYEANEAWHRLGFLPRSERRGRGTGETVLTRWWRSFGQPDLFTLAREQDDRPVAALDTNLLIRGADGDPEVVEHLLADWLRAEVVFGLVDYSRVEVNRLEDKDLRQAHIRYIDGFEEIGYRSNIAEALRTAVLDALGAAAGPHLDDILLATRAAAGGARWFVSEDVPFRKTCAAVLKDLAEIEVVSIAEMILSADRLARGELYNGHYLQGTDVQVREVANGEFDGLVRTFINPRAGESFRSWRRHLEALAKDVARTRLYLFCDREVPIALTVVMVGDIIEVPVCRVRRGPAEPTMARQLLAWLRDKCLELGGRAVEITDENAGQWIVRGCVAEGYLPGQRPVAVPLTGVRTLPSVAAALAEPSLSVRLDPGHAQALAGLMPSPTAALSVERAFHPVIITGAGLPTVRVPIALPYAIELFDHTLSDGRLWSRDRSVALRREHVYFRSPTARSLLKGPARLLWHVTGDKRQGGATLRARSLLNEAVIGDVDQLIRRFSHLGVLNRDEIRGMARNGKVMALRFSHTAVFSRPITLDEYRRMMAVLEPGVGLTHAGPQPVSERVFVHVVTAAT